MAPPLTFLFTSVGRRVELLRHFQHYVEDHPGRLRILGTEIDVFSPAAQLLGDAIRLVPRSDDPSYSSAIADLCESEQVDAVFPLIDPDIAVLGGSTSRIPLRSVASNEAPMVSDKWLTYTWLRSHDIPTPRTWIPGSDDLPDPTDLPLFMKPRRGSGGVDAFVVRDADALRFFTGYIEQPIVQELLKGPEVTVDVLVGRQGEVLASAQRQRLATRGGEVVRGVLVDDPQISEMTSAVVDALKPTGPVTVQGMYDDVGQFRVTEINARMGGGLPLAIAAGIPVAELLVRSYLFEEARPLEPLDVGLHMVRFDESLFYRP
ncbi:ATP-grasp domain-containing protein [Blastococcus sp. Marseille-P5729]|uniref:ATP-grasp domain-containing protein n=1 Tax=Blastococcus sp. Marseille-P5729 TaxID=2086582 RepID=UPI00131D5BDC|nr:ATP-grasp domain-containing protein [Blastococcus sp. Marseille-P5729]